MSGIENKDRNYQVEQTTRAMLDRGMPLPAILTTVEEENRRYFNPPMTRQELINLIQATKEEMTHEEAVREAVRNSKQ